MDAFEQLLKNHNYAPAAIAQMAKEPIVPPSADDVMAESYFNAIIGNYYMQYLALKLEQYGFDLNRPGLTAQELNKADSLITGRLGNEPLDNHYVVQFLERMVVALRKENDHTPVTWEHLFHFTYTSKDGKTTLSGDDLIKAMVRSDRIYHGAQAVHYRHRFLGMAFRTVSIKEFMARVLPKAEKDALKEVNRYGQDVKSIAVDRVRNIMRSMPHLEVPKLRQFYEVNTHHRVMLCIKDLRKLIVETPVDLKAICNIYERLENEQYTRGFYPDEWQRFINELQDALEAIATPYGEEKATTGDVPEELAETVKEAVQQDAANIPGKNPAQQ